MFCPTCGTLNEDGVPFCGGCGAKMALQQQIFRQPVYQQPVCQQPIYQPPSYQQQQPVFQQPMYQQAAYQQPVYQPQWQPMQPACQQVLPGKGMGVAGMILGIVAISLSASWVLGGICAVLAIAFSAIAQAKARRVGRNNGMAIAGLICGGVGLAIAVIFASVAFEMAVAGYENFVDVGMDFTENL